MLKGNVINNMPSVLEGGCAYLSDSCGIQFLVNNNCTTILNINLVNGGWSAVWRA